MPVFAAFRQAPSADADWFGSATAVALLAEVQRETVPQLLRVHGRWGLHLCPAQSFRPRLAANLLREEISLYRSGEHLAGDFFCADAALPLADASLALIYAQHVLETAPEPAESIREWARTLEPEGVAMVLTLNPGGPCRWRWRGHGLRAPWPWQVRAWLEQADLTVERGRYLGRVWSLHGGFEGSDGKGPRRGLDFLRVAHLTIARRRVHGMTPIRPMRPALALKSGVPAA